MSGAVAALGVGFPAPLQTLTFLALSVVPTLKITDLGLVDVDRMQIVPLACGELAATPLG